MQNTEYKIWKENLIKHSGVMDSNGLKYIVDHDVKNSIQKVIKISAVTAIIGLLLAICVSTLVFLEQTDFGAIQQIMIVTGVSLTAAGAFVFRKLKQIMLKLEQVSLQLKQELAQETQQTAEQ